MELQKQRYNLIDEKWIPVSGYGRVSLRDIFSREDLSALGGSPLEKIALFKFLQAIAQAAHTPSSTDKWLALGKEGLATTCLAYLDKWHEAFWLYGSAPFLQMPVVAKAKTIPCATLQSDIATGNSSVLFHSQIARPLDDAQKALLLLVTQSCCFSGKKVDKNIVLTPGIEKTANAKAGPALCSKGLLHSFLLGKNIQETIWLNLLTRENIATERLYEEGVGTPPWEKMPAGEADDTARSLCRSLMGRLVPMSRFLLLDGDSVHSVEGIQHPDYLHGGMVDPSVTGDRSSKKPKMIWADPNKRPWRNLPALLSFLSHDETSHLRCLQLYWCIPRIRLTSLQTVTVWSGGIRLSSNAGEQYLTGKDNLVESEISFPRDIFKGEGEDWYLAFSKSMEDIEKLGKIVYSSVSSYYKDEKSTTYEGHAEQASLLFWQMAENQLKNIINFCTDKEEKDSVFRILRGYVLDCYAQFCPHETARQLQHWAKNRPFSHNKKKI